jgi:hypothetical protein
MLVPVESHASDLSEAFLFLSLTDRIATSQKTGVPLPSLHSSLFWPVPEPTIRTGVKAMTVAVLELMKK